jgi:hypothetical protein
MTIYILVASVRYWNTGLIRIDFLGGLLYTTERIMPTSKGNGATCWGRSQCAVSLIFLQFEPGTVLLEGEHPVNQ